MAEASNEYITTLLVRKSLHLRQSFELPYKESPMFLVRTHVNKWRDIVTYHGLVWSNISPPLGYRDIWQNNRKENNNGGQNEARVKSCGGDIVVSMPPTAPSASNPVVEYEAKDNP